MSLSNSSVPDSVPASPAGRWLQLCAGLLCMIAVTNLQYGWILFSVLGGIAFFAWRETASLFQAICTASLLIPHASF